MPKKRCEDTSSKKDDKYLTKEEGLELVKIVKDLIAMDKELEKQIAELKSLMIKNGHLKTDKLVYVS